MDRPLRDQRKPESLDGRGDEPDLRFWLANERTGLAWMPAALALVAAGIAIISIGCGSFGVTPLLPFASAARSSDWRVIPQLSMVFCSTPL